MQIVIDIPNLDWSKVKNGSMATANLLNAVRNGTPLPKRHGDLKDMGNLQYVFDLTRNDFIYSGKDIEKAIKSMTTIIEAESEE